MPESESNIFSHAASQGRKKNDPASVANVVKNVGDVGDPEVDDLLGRLRSMNSHIKHAFESVAREMGMTTEQLHAWFEEGSHLNPAEKQLLREITEDLNHKISTAAVDQKKLRKSDSEIDSEVKNRKAKTLGSRKNWIPIR